MPRKNHEARGFLSPRHLTSLCDMRKVIPLPKRRSQAQNEAAGEIGSTEVPMDVDPVASLPSRLTPDLEVDPSVSATSGLLPARDQRSSGA